MAGGLERHRPSRDTTFPVDGFGTAPDGVVRQVELVADLSERQLASEETQQVKLSSRERFDVDAALAALMFSASSSPKTRNRATVVSMVDCSSSGAVDRQLAHIDPTEAAREVAGGAFTQVRLIEWTNNLQPHIDRKRCAAGNGLVFEDSTAADSDTTELQSFTISGT